MRSEDTRRAFEEHVARVAGALWRTHDRGDLGTIQALAGLTENQAKKQHTGRNEVTWRFLRARLMALPPEERLELSRVLLEDLDLACAVVDRCPVRAEVPETHLLSAARLVEQASALNLEAAVAMGDRVIDAHERFALRRKAEGLLAVAANYAAFFAPALDLVQPATEILQTVAGLA